MASLTIVRRIRAPIERVFNAFIDPEKIALWWGPDAGPVIQATVDARQGGLFHVRFRMEDGTEHASSGVIESFDPPHRLEMTWRWEGDEDQVSRVEVTLKATDDGTELTFTHAQLSDDASRDSHEEGWNGALDKLEARAGEL